MIDTLKSENLIDLHEQLDLFALHHQNKGAQDAHRLIKKVLIDDEKKLPREGSTDKQKWYEGYDTAISQVLSLIRENFFL
jgi:hypothetical protein